MGKDKSPAERLEWLEFRDAYIEEQARLECFYCLKPLVSDAPDPDRLKKPKDRVYVRTKVPAKKMATIDHVVPLSKGGGQFDRDNIVVCCPTCNSNKGNLLLEEWEPGNPTVRKQVKRLLLRLQAQTIFPEE